jgi:predicted cobalt transporter CbtA
MTMNLFKNIVFLGVFAGLAATIVKDALNQTLYSLKIIKILFAQYAAGVFIRTRMKIWQAQGYPQRGAAEFS